MTDRHNGAPAPPAAPGHRVTARQYRVPQAGLGAAEVTDGGRRGRPNPVAGPAHGEPHGAGGGHPTLCAKQAAGEDQRVRLWPLRKNHTSIGGLMALQFQKIDTAKKIAQERHDLNFKVFLCWQGGIDSPENH